MSIENRNQQRTTDEFAALERNDESPGTTTDEAGGGHAPEPPGTDHGDHHDHGDHDGGSDGPGPEDVELGFSPDRPSPEDPPLA